MTWKMIEGYRCPYRISDQGEVQRQTKDRRWVRVSAHLSRNRAYLTLRKADGIPQKVAVVRLMDTYFFGGRAKRDNMHLMHKNGAKMDCAVENLVITTKEEIGKHWGGTGRRKAVVRRDRNGAETMYKSITAVKLQVKMTEISNRQRAELEQAKRERDAHDCVIKD